METIELGVILRETNGKGSVREIRRQGKVPAVLYGAQRNTMAIAVDGREFETKIGNIEGTHLIRLTSAVAELGGRLVLVKEVPDAAVEKTMAH